MPYRDPCGCGKGSRFSDRKPEFADTLKKYYVQQQIVIRIEKLSFLISCPFQAVRPTLQNRFNLERLYYDAFKGLPFR